MHGEIVAIKTVLSLMSPIHKVLSLNPVNMCANHVYFTFDISLFICVQVHCGRPTSTKVNTWHCVFAIYIRKSTKRSGNLPYHPLLSLTFQKIASSADFTSHDHMISMHVQLAITSFLGTICDTDSNIPESLWQSYVIVA